MPPFEDRLAGIEALIRQAALSLPTEIPAALSRAVALLESTSSVVQGSTSSIDRQLAVARLKQFQVRLKLFSAAMQRGEAIFQGYARHAGASLHEYGPAGDFGGARDPAFFSLTV